MAEPHIASPPRLSGIHHVTAIAGDPQRNLDFYTEVIGLRLVKRTVNFDDAGTYHLYFGNATGAPGSILTFFPWPGVRRGVIGNGQVTASSFAVARDAVAFWRDRLRSFGIPVTEAEPRFDEPVLRFDDPDGLGLEIIGTERAQPTSAWSRADIPADHAICGFHSVTLSAEAYEGTAALLSDVMRFALIGQDGSRYRFAAPGGAAASIVDVLCAPAGPEGALGAGTVHHIAWRTPDDAQQAAWRGTLVKGGYNVSPIMDRSYFRSIYYREPGGVLFEIATDPPGFATDESVEHLGERLMLPRWLEKSRPAIEHRLAPLTLNV